MFKIVFDRNQYVNIHKMFVIINSCRDNEIKNNRSICFDRLIFFSFFDFSFHVFCKIFNFLFIVVLNRARISSYVDRNFFEKKKLISRILHEKINNNDESNHFMNLIRRIIQNCILSKTTTINFARFLIWLIFFSSFSKHFFYFLFNAYNSINVISCELTYSILSIFFGDQNLIFHTIQKIDQIDKFDN